MPDMRIGGSTVLVMSLLATLLLDVACDRAPRGARLTLIGVSDHANEYVSAASDGGMMVALAWAATSETTGTNILAAMSSDGGETFSAPVRVNSVQAQADVNGEQPPRVALARGVDGALSVVILWTAKGDSGTSLLYASSRDGGRTFDPTRSLPGVDAPGNRGWESLAAASDGQLYALWLDHRDGAQTMSGHGHVMQHRDRPEATPAVDGVTRAQRSQLFVSSLGGSVPPKGIARGVCYCCKTALAAGADGAVYAAWRHVYEGNQRDIAFTMSRDAGRSFAAPVRVSQDEWQLDGCPENGPAIAAAPDRRIHVVWPTLVRANNGEMLRLFHASSEDGRSFTPRVELPALGSPQHPQIAAAPDVTLVVAWDEIAAGRRHVRVATGRANGPDGITFAAEAAGVDDRPGSNPALAVTPRGVVLAWTRRGETGSSIAVERLDY